VSSPDAIKAIVQDAFEDVALLISGAAVLHQLDDRLIRTLVRRLGRVRTRALSRLARTGHQTSDRPSPAPACRLHPAVEVFLRTNRHHDNARAKEVDRVS
jgi:hypothetical protein